MRARSVLIVAWYFPPDGGAGSQRPASFARELPRLGWETSVLTRGTGHQRGRWETRDESLLPEIGSEARLERVEELPQIEHGASSSGDGIPGRARPLCDRLLEVVGRDPPDLVFLTMSPFFFASLVEPLRSAGETRIVLDLRDPWALDYWPTYRNRARFRAQEQFMLRTFAAVDGVVMNTPLAREELFRVFGESLPSGFEERVTVVENGFTRADFVKDVREPDADVLEITHTGTFHCEHLRGNRSLLEYLSGLRHCSRARIDRTGRTPLYLLRAAARLSSEDAVFGEDIRFRFIGHTDDPLRRCVQGSDLADKVLLEGYRPHEDAVEAMRTAGALFLPGARLPNELEDLIVPGKTYEYLASGRPILGAVHEGDARRLLERAGGSYLCDPCELGSIATQLKRLHEDWKSGLLEGNRLRKQSVLDEYERTRLAERLAAFLDKVQGLPRVGS